MKKELLSAMAIFLATTGMQTVVAQNATDILTPEKGYELVTAMPENLNDYYFILTEKRATDLMVTATSTDGPRYMKATDPGENKNVVWMIEPENGFNGYETGYAIQSLSENTYIKPGGNDPWNVWLSAQSELTGVTQFVFSYNETDGYWTFKNGPNKGENYLGTWDNIPEAFVDNSRMAANKTGDNIGQYLIYSIERTAYSKYEIQPLIDELTTLKAELNAAWGTKIDQAIDDAEAATDDEAIFAAVQNLKAMITEISDFQSKKEAELPRLVTFCESLYTETETSMSEDTRRNAFKEAMDAAQEAVETAASVEELTSAIGLYQKAVADFAPVAKPAEGSSLNFSYYVEQLSYSIDGWTKTYTCQNHAHKNSTEKNNGEYAVTEAEGFIENWNPSHFSTAGQLSYSLTELPAGLYTISAYTFDNVMSGKVEFFAGDQSKTIDASTNLFSLSVLENVKVDASGILTFGINVPEANVTNWVGISHIQLAKTGILDNSELITALQEKLLVANELVAQAMAADKKSALNTAIAKAEAVDENSTVNEISEAATALDAAILGAQESIPEYEKFKAILDDVNAKAETLTDYDTETYTAAINEKLTAYNEGTLAEISDETLALYTILADAAKSQKWQAGTDYTLAIINNSFETGDLTGWVLPNGQSSDTNVVTPDGSHATEGADGNYIFNTWWQGVPMEQTIEGLPEGKYTLSLLYTGEAPETSGFYVVANGTPSEKFTTAEAGKLQEVSTVAVVGEDGKLVIRVQGSAEDGSYAPENYWFWYKTDNFRLTPVVETINVSVTGNGWSTMILPFAAEIPQGMTVYSCNEVDENNQLVLNETDQIEANTPYIIESEEETYSFTGANGSSKDSYNSGFLTGVYANTQVPAGSYLLRDEAETSAFYLIEEGNEQTVNAYNAYLSVPAESGITAAVLTLPNNGGTAIETIESAETLVNVYSISGILIRKDVKKNEALNGLSKGIYIINGVKTVIK